MRLLLGQTGAPTAVVNRSVAGFLAGARGHDVLLARGGPDALVTGAFTPLADVSVPAGAAESGGSWLGGGRRATTTADVDAIVTSLMRHRVDGLALIGGNGTMALLDAVSRRAHERHVPLRVTGIPKTIDNDLDGVDHAPGYASAARYLTTVLPDMARDHASMTSVEPVRIVETMGRGAGWLALAATFPVDPAYPVHRVFPPETPFEPTTFLADITGLVQTHGRALVVVSEGFAAELSSAPIHEANHTRLITGGVARTLAALVTEQLGLPARGEVLGVAQRCCSALVSEIDAAEAEACGLEAARALTERTDAATATMIGLTRASSPGYAVHHPRIPLREVAGRVRSVPPEWHGHDPRDLSRFHAWLAPLIGAALPATPALTIPTEEP